MHKNDLKFASPNSSASFYFNTSSTEEVNNLSYLLKIGYSVINSNATITKVVNIPNQPNNENNQETAAATTK